MSKKKLYKRQLAFWTGLFQYPAVVYYWTGTPSGFWVYLSALVRLSVCMLYNVTHPDVICASVWMCIRFT